MTETVLYERQGPVAWLTLNRPDKLNAITLDMNLELIAALARAAEDDEIKVVALTGAGKAFSAGHDLKEEVDAGLVGAERWHVFLDEHLQAVRAIWACPKPVIAAVHGWCLGGGFEFALASDLIVASSDAQFGHVEIRYGSGPVTLMLPFLVPEKRAREMLLTGETVDADEGYRIGFVNQITSPESLEDAVLAYAAKIAPAPLPVLRLTKLALTRAYEAMGLFAAVNSNLDLSAILNAAETPDQQEFDRIAGSDGLRAALAWRDSRYEGVLGEGARGG